MKFLMVFNSDETVDVYRVDSVSEGVLEAIIALIHARFTMHPDFNRYYEETLSNLPMINEQGKIMQLSKEHPCAICETYEKFEDEK